MTVLYGRRWAKARKQYISEHPYCTYCIEDGNPHGRGDVVDHIEPHRGDPVLFWDVDNWQTLCNSHHNSTKQALEKGSAARGCNTDGVPIDRAHHWNQ